MKTSGAVKRVQLSRAKGWRMPTNTVKVDRTTKWGNPWRVGEQYVIGQERGQDVLQTFSARECVERFRLWLGRSAEGRRLAELAAVELRGKNLACWCRLGSPCHADVLLELANP